MSFEEQYKALEEILVRLERGDLSLDASLAEYEKGVAALRACREVLSRAERRIEELGAEAQAAAMPAGQAAGAQTAGGPAAGRTGGA